MLVICRANCPGETSNTLNLDDMLSYLNNEDAETKNALYS
jgi:hypothetical protein